MLLQASFRVLS